MSLILFFCFLILIIFNIKPFFIRFDVNCYYNTKLLCDDTPVYVITTCKQPKIHARTAPRVPLTHRAHRATRFAKR